ncbi:hypothetical protein NN561_010254 [Cricetulus griseus]
MRGDSGPPAWCRTPGLGPSNKHQVGRHKDEHQVGRHESIHQVSRPGALPLSPRPVRNTLSQGLRPQGQPSGRGGGELSLLYQTPDLENMLIWNGSVSHLNHPIEMILYFASFERLCVSLHLNNSVLRLI